MRFKKNVKPAKVALMLKHLQIADRALCDAMLTNTLTGVGERSLGNLLHWVRECVKDAQKELNTKEQDDG